MKIKGKLHWGLQNGEIETDHKPHFDTTLKTEGRVILATLDFPKNVSYDIEFDGNSLKFQKYVNEEPRP